jgi:hypothetical protein
VTLSLPVVAGGTVATISELETTVKVAGVPLKVTSVAPVKLFPRTTMIMIMIVTLVPPAARGGTVCTIGGRSMARLKIVPLRWPNQS